MKKCIKITFVSQKLSSHKRLSVHCFQTPLLYTRIKYMKHNPSTIIFEIMIDMQKSRKQEI